MRWSGTRLTFLRSQRRASAPAVTTRCTDTHDLPDNSAQICAGIQGISGQILTALLAERLAFGKLGPGIEGNSAQI